MSGKKLFVKPKALVVISIKGLDDFTYDGHVFNFTDNFKSHGIKNDLEEHFGDGMMHVNLNSSGIFGTPHFKRNTDSFEFNGTDANQDIENMHKLATLIKDKDRKNANVVDYYRIHLDVSNARSDSEKAQLIENMKRGIDTLQDAIKDSHGGNIIAEIYTHEQVSENASFMKLRDIRKVYQVTRPRSYDYPATFAICLFVCVGILFVRDGIYTFSEILFFQAATSMVWFMMDDGDMGKNSLVYRLSTGRPKKD